MAKKNSYPDLIVKDRMLSDAILKQVRAAGLTMEDLSRKTEFYGHKIDKTVLSCYFNKNKKITQRSVIFLAKMFGISIEVKVYRSEVNQRTLPDNLRRYVESWKSEEY